MAEKTLKQVQALFKVSRIETRESGDRENPLCYDIELTAVCDGSEANKQFWKYTPAGNMKLSTINAAAAEIFINAIGKKGMLLTFTQTELKK